MSEEFRYCQAECEDREKCKEQCKHCAAYYAPLEVDRLQSEIARLKEELKNALGECEYWNNECIALQSDLSKAKAEIKNQSYLLSKMIIGISILKTMMGKAKMDKGVEVCETLIQHRSHPALITPEKLLKDE